MHKEDGIHRGWPCIEDGHVQREEGNEQRKDSLE